MDLSLALGRPDEVGRWSEELRIWREAHPQFAPFLRK
jgi:hypothetical protein